MKALHWLLFACYGLLGGVGLSMSFEGLDRHDYFNAVVSAIMCVWALRKAISLLEIKGGTK